MLQFLTTSASTLADLTKGITDAVSTGDIIDVVKDAVVAGMPFALGWFGIRYTKRAVTKGIFRGRI